MKIATWNVNSLRIRLRHVQEWLKLNSIDVLCLQELKLSDEKFPIDELANSGYNAYFTGQKTYNGVAILINQKSIGQATDVIHNLPNFQDDQKRLIAVTVAGIRIVCGYFPNGQSLESEKFIYKMKWLNAITYWLFEEMKKYPRLALLGDYNIAPEDRDVHDPQKWEGQNLVSPQERKAFSRLENLGLHDAFRLFKQPEKTFSWWDYRMNAFRRNAGMRIDHILLSQALTEVCIDCKVDRTPRTWEKPSDHAPVITTLKYF
ncbi:exodeoxyribonuclease III [Candidatus Pandoraea novymonadis]|uniref:Exodeoxyribonuclease III n=1 Tax=Candidatus Pandoraea novymonadis TaxID=1808959 RepID=A0ABX5FGP5_9BURK|nr:exodeoxyribonuclease III [Candidatus Pandoraea novymonadis]PSB92132.1 Exodeoxyribonuclease III [Candidatus Pandoraea novymonadis]